MGYDFGTTTGIAFTALLPSENSSMPVLHLDYHTQTDHVISNNKECTDLSYSITSIHTPETVTMFITPVHTETQRVRTTYAPNCGFYAPGGIFSPCTEDDYCSLTTPVFFNITLLPCPPGFTSLDQRCDCYLAIFLRLQYHQWNKLLQMEYQCVGRN